jgi:hypothetical protein
MRKVARVAIAEAERWLGCRVVGELDGSKVGTKVGSITGGIIPVCVISAAPDVITHFSPLSGFREQP